MRGGQHQVLLLMEGLREAGHRCTLLARRAGRLWHEAEQRRFVVQRASCRQIFRDSATADLVHAHDARAHVLASVATRVPLVVSRRVAFPLRHSLASAWKYRRTSRLIAISQAVKRELRNAGISGAKIDVVYDGVELWGGESAWEPAGPVVALASRDPLKGGDLLQRAIQLSGRTVIFSENLSRDLPGAAMFVYITRSEGLGSAALVAMNLGVPVIASRIGGLPEAIIDGDSGILVENDAEAIATAIRRLDEDPNLARSLAERARMRVAENFSRENLIAGTLASYGRALAA